MKGEKKTGRGEGPNGSVCFMSKHQNIHIVTNILVFVSGAIKERAGRPLQPFTLSHRGGAEAWGVNMSAFMDALRSCTGLSGAYSCSNGPPRSSSLRAEKGREAQWTPCCWRWACALMDAPRLHPYDKSHKRASLRLLLRSVSPPRCAPLSCPAQTQKRGLIVCCESQRL